MRIGLGIGLNRFRGGQAAAGGPDFRILVNTANAGVSNNDQFQFTGAVGNYDVQVWNEAGTAFQETFTGLSGAATITMTGGAGTYELRVFASEVSGFNRIHFNNTGDKDKLIEVRNWGDISWSSFAFAASFFGCSNLQSVTSFVAPNLSAVTTLNSAFYNCTNLVTLDVSNWNTENVTNFSTFAIGCSSLTALEAGNWNTSNANDFSFFARNCSSLTVLDVSNWNTSNVTNFTFFASGCTSLTDITGIEDFNISNVTNFTNFLLLVTLPTSRYDQLLINYEAQAPNTGLSFHGGNSKYTAGSAAAAARTNLETTYNWNITDGGLAPGILNAYKGSAFAMSPDTLLYSSYSGTDDISGSVTNGDSGQFSVAILRDSDNAVRSFTPAEVADGTANTWVQAGGSSANGFVRRGYDQSVTALDVSNLNHADQESTPAMPKLFDSSTGLILENGKAAMEISSGQTLVSLNSSGVGNTNNFSIIGVFSKPTIGNNNLAAFAIDGGNLGSLISVYPLDQANLNPDGGVRLFFNVQVYAENNSTRTGQHVFSVDKSTTNIFFRVDNNQVASFAETASLPAQSVNIYVSGNFVNQTFDDGKIQAVVYYNLQNSNISTIENLINTEYNNIY